uniref:Uncharacterized protein n=1 Tax=Plectus sambesii TaxID=2011161 RepID=A0A914XEN2_9BILA
MVGYHLLFSVVVLFTCSAFKLPPPAPSSSQESEALDYPSEIEIISHSTTSSEIGHDAAITPSPKGQNGQERRLPPGPIPAECCRTFCFPIEVNCICCFEDYDYFDGLEIKTARGVPDSLKNRPTSD